MRCLSSFGTIMYKQGWTKTANHIDSFTIHNLRCKKRCICGKSLKDRNIRRKNPNMILYHLDYVCVHFCDYTKRMYLKSFNWMLYRAIYMFTDIVAMVSFAFGASFQHIVRLKSLPTYLHVYIDLHC